jgi:hypothetical protein
MHRHRAVGIALALTGLGAAIGSLPGCDDPGTLRAVRVDSAVVRSSSVQPDAARTWEAERSDVRPDSTLVALLEDGLPVEVAWRPLLYRCDDPRGPRLTVQLTRPDARMATRGFTPGTGRLGCSEELMRYVASWIEG